MDLGVSSPQIDDPERGFSFMHDGPLDMRMNQDQILDARHIVNHYEETQLVEIFKDYGEERFAKRIAANICKTRALKEIETTFELSDRIIQMLFQFLLMLLFCKYLLQFFSQTVLRHSL